MLRRVALMWSITEVPDRGCKRLGGNGAGVAGGGGMKVVEEKGYGVTL